MIECKKILYAIKCESDLGLSISGNKIPFVSICFLNHTEPDHETQKAIEEWEYFRIHNLVNKENKETPIQDIREINYAIRSRYDIDAGDGKRTPAIKLEYLDSTEPPDSVKKSITKMELGKWKDLYNQGIEAVLKNLYRDPNEMGEDRYVANEKHLNRYKNELREFRKRMDELEADSIESQSGNPTDSART